MIDYKLIDEEVLQGALDHFGLDFQLKMATEECAELIVAINHWDRGRVGPEKIAEELADVLILINELVIGLTGPDMVNKFLKEKIDRLRKRVQNRLDGENTRTPETNS